MCCGWTASVSAEQMLMQRRMAENRKLFSLCRETLSCVGLPADEMRKSSSRLTNFTTNILNEAILK